MEYEHLLDENLSDLTNLLAAMTPAQKEIVGQIGITAANSLKNGGTVFWCGNGGSAADSLHLSAELVGRLVNNRSPLASIALTADIAALTCISNDFGYETIFSRQLEGLGAPGDFLISLSTSGESENVIQCVKQARKMGISSASLLGKGGGRQTKLSDFEIIIKSQKTARIQEVHKFVGHTICQIIERELGYKN